jgi:hypothetical protein
VADAGARGHDLHVVGADDRTGADAVLVLERTLQHVRQDLHVAVAVRPESLSRLDAVLVDDAQRTEAHVRGVVVLAERERVPAVEPAEIGAAARVRESRRDHRFSLPGVGSFAQ